MITKVLHFFNSIHNGDCKTAVIDLKNKLGMLESERERLKLANTNQQLRIVSLEGQLAKQEAEFKVSMDHLLTQIEELNKKKSTPRKPTIETLAVTQ